MLVPPRTDNCFISRNKLRDCRIYSIMCLGNLGRKASNPVVRW